MKTVKYQRFKKYNSANYQAVKKRYNFGRLVTVQGALKYSWGPRQTCHQCNLKWGTRCRWAILMIFFLSWSDSQISSFSLSSLISKVSYHKFAFIFSNQNYKVLRHLKWSGLLNSLMTSTDHNFSAFTAFVAHSAHVFRLQTWSFYVLCCSPICIN